MNTTIQTKTALPALGRFRLYVKALEWGRKVLALPIRGCLRDQLHRAAISVVLNVAEGGGLSSRGAKNRHFQIAMASLWEVSAVLDLTAADARVARVRQDLVEGLRELNAMLGALLR